MSSAPWVPQHDKDFLIGQRLIYNRTQIVVCIGRVVKFRLRIRFVSGTEADVDPINLQPLPGGQL